MNNGCFAELANRWPSSVIAREKVSIATGGAVSPKSLANADSLGKGPDGAFRVGKKVCYPIASLIAWLEQRTVHREESVQHKSMVKARAARKVRPSREG